METIKSRIKGLVGNTNFWILMVGSTVYRAKVVGCNEESVELDVIATNNRCRDSAKRISIPIADIARVSSI